MVKSLEKIFILLSVVPLIGILLFPPDYRYIGDVGWYFLLAILAVHPLVDIFPNIILFKKMMPLRKSAGILCGSLLISHSVAYFVSTTGLSWSSLTSQAIWDPKEFFFWGMIGIFIIILLTLTSNLWSVIHLKKWWKRLHFLTYVAFFMGAIHQILIILNYEAGNWNSRMLSTLIPILILVFLRILAMSNLKINVPLKKDALPGN